MFWVPPLILVHRFIELSEGLDGSRKLLPFRPECFLCGWDWKVLLYRTKLCLPYNNQSAKSVSTTSKKFFLGGRDVLGTSRTPFREYRRRRRLKFSLLGLEIYFAVFFSSLHNVKKEKERKPARMFFICVSCGLFPFPASLASPFSAALCNSGGHLLKRRLRGGGTALPPAFFRLMTRCWALSELPLASVPGEQPVETGAFESACGYHNSR